MTQSRFSVQNDFPRALKILPQLLYINGQPEWVDNLLKFGDLIEESMGRDARDFYFEQLHSLLETRLAYTFVDIDDEEEKPVAQPKKEVKKSKSQDDRKRLF
jgi:hypothetical protein